MPRYFFHLYDDIVARDVEGVELPDAGAARDYAVKNVREIFGETAKEQGRVVLSHRIDIADQSGKVLDQVWFRDAVKIES